MAEGTAIDWCVADLGTDRALGGVTVFSRGGAITDAAELGYQFFPSARGRGAAKEAARLAVAHALAPTSEGGLGLRRLVAETAADNEASNAVLRSVGFVEFGREHAVDRVADGGWGDGLYWELPPTHRRRTPRGRRRGRRALDRGAPAGAVRVCHGDEAPPVTPGRRGQRKDTR